MTGVAPATGGRAKCHSRVPVASVVRCEPRFFARRDANGAAHPHERLSTRAAPTEMNMGARKGKRVTRMTALSPSVARRASPRAARNLAHHALAHPLASPHRRGARRVLEARTTRGARVAGAARGGQDDARASGAARRRRGGQDRWCSSRVVSRRVFRRGGWPKSAARRWAGTIGYEVRFDRCGFRRRRGSSS